MEDDLTMAKAIIMVQQQELVRLRERIQQYKEEQKENGKHNIKIKDGTLVIKIKDNKWVLSANSITYNDKVYEGTWAKLYKNYLSMSDADGRGIFAYDIPYPDEFCRVELYFMKERYYYNINETRVEELQKMFKQFKKIVTQSNTTNNTDS